VAAGVAEYVINAGMAIDLKKAGTTQIWAASDAGAEQQAEFRELLRSVIPEVFDNGR